jgi:hypothetical protein
LSAVFASSDPNLDPYPADDLPHVAHAILGPSNLVDETIQFDERSDRGKVGGSGPRVLLGEGREASARDILELGVGDRDHG